MEQLPNCPKCNSEYTYEDGSLLICPECAHEWTASDEEENTEFTVKDANGATLRSGDDVTIIKDLKVKGSSSVVKVGTKIKNIRLVESAIDHNIDCKIPGVGALKITPMYVKKS
ncbi:zinc ribbon domain-containing protein YjdM [Poseidonibacter ostreae]|jgi:protein PhnA|uniref:Alkylphosphonate utilization protein n=1 Tax=Poseidonibacter ostreae TaxID=2654171 RepID=A0A6L4WTF8_9BACT|nr:zinc ribbon domain-containing protein YjdM [Poseidonibacter ostreae]KAB7887064.1 alkylphosphonate utilization protein [Poseidonibacter ostreae]KAB7889212.1 alkylphosphonate utilization protein [Poseidonibacter ostreae]KAB7891587.1 alkylphosphonate utilization protein [Poseidonibacter ostreae]